MKQLTRICSSCKMEKPLAAFLQINATKGTSYGSICSACRSKEVKNKAKSAPGDDDSRSSGFRIGAKEKEFADREQFRLKKDIEDLYKIDLRKKEELSQEKTQKAEKEATRIRHAETKQTVLRTFLPKQNTTTADTTAMLLTASEQEQASREKLSEKEFVEKEIRKSVTDFSNTILHPLQGTQLDSTTVQGYLKVLGDKAPLTVLLKKGFSQMTFSDKSAADKQTDAQKEQDLSTLAKNNWGKKR